MIGLLDCNNFYASCERAFNPLLRNTPVIVLSNNDGCVIARSNEAKLLGIRMGVPAFKVKNLIQKNHVHVFSSNYALYGDMSERVMNILKREVENVEVYSIDEAFLDLSQLPDKERIKSIRDKVFKWTNLPVSIGVAPTKCLSKVANQIAKKKIKSGIYILEGDKNISQALKEFSVADLWGIGRKYVKKLNKLGVNNALEFRDLNQNWVRKNMSINGVRIQKELKGEKCFDLETVTKRKKNICTSRSFGKEIKSYERLVEALSSFAGTCAMKLRLEKSCCSNISVFILTNPHNSNIEQRHSYLTLQFDTPTNDSIEIVKMAIKGLKMIYREGTSYKKAGVIAGNTTPSDQVQMSLFDRLKRGKRKRLMSSVDKINQLMGRDTVRIASQGYGRKWKLRQERLSPCYTTRFSDILKAV